MTAKTRYLLLAFALLGLGASAASTYVHHQLVTDPTYASFCDVSTTVSCTQAYLSRYGSLFGIPVALLGVLFFAAVVTLVVFAPQPAFTAPAKKLRGETQSPPASATAAVLLLSAIGLAFSLYLAWASFFQLRALCLLCATTYVAVLGLFIVSARAKPVPFSAIPARAVQEATAVLMKPAALAGLLVVLVGGIAGIAAFPAEPAETTADASTAGQSTYLPLTDEDRAQFEEWYRMQPVVDVPIDRGNAKVLIVKFNDYQCPPCRQTYEQYRSILAKYTAGGDVKYVIKHFPLDFECNPRNANHMAACEAAAAALMAEELGTAEKLEHWLFANQGPPLLSPDEVRRAAAVIGGIKDFDARYPAVLNQVKADVELGQKLGVQSTPTFFINGRRIPGGLPPAAFEAAIQLELNRR